jgi:uncharacterized protein involved in exopolysaccharide biosynthesis
MPDLFYLLGKWWKQITIVICLATLAVAALVFSMPLQYLSTATALPSNELLADKSAVFKENIQQLYSNLGTPDELDRMIGTARLDTLYIAVANAFNLWDHYKVEGEGQKLSYKTAAILKRNTQVIKSEYGELKVKVWDTDRELAPQLANAIMNELNAIYRSLQSRSNQSRLESVKQTLSRLDSMNDNSAMTVQRSRYKEIVEEYELIVDANPSALLIVENARPANSPDKPRRAMLISGTALLSFLFAVLLALILERRKRRLQ